MKVIDITKKTASKTEQIELVISILCLLNGITLSKTENSVLAYFVVYGIKESTDELLVSSDIVSGIPQLRNIKTKLCKLGFLKRTKDMYKTYELNLSKDFEFGKVVRLYIKVDRS